MLIHLYSHFSVAIYFNLFVHNIVVNDITHLQRNCLASVVNWSLLRFLPLLTSEVCIDFLFHIVCHFHVLHVSSQHILLTV